MSGLVQAIHVLLVAMLRDVDARHKAGHDEVDDYLLTRPVHKTPFDGQEQQI
jgi:hypothetical protein